MNCRHHPDREATAIVEIANVAVCEDCAKIESENGLAIIRIHEDDEILNARIIDA